MKISRTISINRNEIEDFKEGKIIEVKKGTSFCGENSKQSFVNEIQKDIELVIFFEVEEEDIKKLKMEDVNDFDILECDIKLFDEVRTAKDFSCKVIDFSDGRDDVGYIEIEIEKI